MKPSEVLEHLVRFVEDPEDVATMTRGEVRAELEAEGVDLEAQSARLRERLAFWAEERTVGDAEGVDRRGVRELR